jgi:hypothetical protein
MADLSIEIVDLTFGASSYLVLVTSLDSVDQVPSPTNVHIAIRGVS